MIPIPDSPLMPQACADLLDSLLQRSTEFVEYGSGGSTLMALSHKVPRITSVDSDSAWLDAIGQRRATMEPAYGGVHETCWIDIGATGEWGYPQGSEGHTGYWRYPAAPWLGRQAGTFGDLVLIDGRFRAACLLLSGLHARKGATILFDDYADRPWYHTVEAVLQPKRRVDRMAVFTLDTPLTVDADFLSVLLPVLQDSR